LRVRVIGMTTTRRLAAALLVLTASGCALETGTTTTAECRLIGPDADERSTMGYASLTDDASYVAGVWYGPVDVGSPIIGYASVEDGPIWSAPNC
jgi:hypothetical protein